MPPYLDPRKIKLKADGIPSRLEVKDVVTSTNRVLFESRASGAGHGVVIVADAQTAGRGRLGRTWESPPGKNLYFSLLIDRHISQANPSELVIVFAVSLVRSLSKAGGIPLQVRWPNDIYGGNRKLAGILMEYIAGRSGGPFVIAGVGINVNGGAKDFSPELRRSATSLKLLAQHDFDRGTVLDLTLAAMDADLERYGKTGLNPFIDEWMRATDLHGKELKIESNEGNFEGLFAGLDLHGALQVETKGGALRTVISGDARLVKPI